MYAVLGFAAGFVLGARAGQEGLAEIVKGFNAVRQSDEFGAAVETGKGLLMQTLKAAVEMGTGVVTGEVKSLARLRAA